MSVVQRVVVACVVVLGVAVGAYASHTYTYKMAILGNYPYTDGYPAGFNLYIPGERLYYKVLTLNTPTNRAEVHVYKSGKEILHTVTPWTAEGIIGVRMYLTDWDHDHLHDIKMLLDASVAPSGEREIHVLSGRSNYKVAIVGRNY